MSVPGLRRQLFREAIAKGGIEPGKYTYLKCPECGLVQDAANSKCTRCGHDLTEARKGMFAYYEKKGIKPPLHDKPPPPASQQTDERKAMQVTAAQAIEYFARKFTAEQRRELAKQGKAKPDGSFPIENGEDLDNAIGLARTPSDRAHVKKRAAALGQTGKIPDDWK